MVFRLFIGYAPRLFYFPAWAEKDDTMVTLGENKPRLDAEDCKAVLIPVVMGLSTLADRKDLRSALLEVSQHLDELLAAASVVAEDSKKAYAEYMRKRLTPTDA
jgi:hypothetical protein